MAPPRRRRYHPVMTGMAGIAPPSDPNDVAGVRLRAGLHRRSYVSIVLLAAKYWAYRLTGSTAILSDALESIVNVVAAVFALGGLVFAGRPADRNHPYGHGKIEFFSAAFEGRAHRLRRRAHHLRGRAGVDPRRRGARASTRASSSSSAAGLVNLALGLLPRPHRAPARVADAGRRRPARALRLLDQRGHRGRAPPRPRDRPALARSAGRRGGGGEPHVDRVQARAPRRRRAARRGGHASCSTGSSTCCRATWGRAIIRVHHLRAIRAGRFHHVDAHLVVPEFWTVDRAHEMAEDLAEQVIRELGVEGELAFHTDPCHRVYCAMCDLDDCPVRREPFRDRPVAHAGGSRPAGHAARGRLLSERSPVRRAGGRGRRRAGSAASRRR